MVDVYIGKSGTKTSKSLIKILGPAIGIIKDKSEIREQAIIFGGQLGDSVIFENCKTLFKRISEAYFSWNNSKKNFNDLGGKADSIRFRVTEEGFIGPTNKNPKIKYATDIRFKPLQFYIEKLQPVQQQYDEANLLGKVLRAFRDMPDGEPTQITGRHPLEVSMYVWAAIYLDWLHAGRPNNKNDHTWYIDLFEEYLENERLSLVLYKCFRGAAATSDEQLLKMVERECNAKIPYLDEPREEGEEGDEESMDVEHEHVCNDVCADLHYVKSVSSEKFLKEKPDLKEIIPLLMQGRCENDKHAVPCTSTSSEIAADPVPCSSTSSEIAVDPLVKLTMEKMKQANYIQMVHYVEDVSLYECPKDVCRQRTEYDDLPVTLSSNDDKVNEFRCCPACRQFYHAVCRKANKNECVKCGHKGRRDEKDQHSSDEEDEEWEDDESEDGEGEEGEELDVEMGDVEMAAAAAQHPTTSSSSAAARHEDEEADDGW